MADFGFGSLGIKAHNRFALRNSVFDINIPRGLVYGYTESSY